MKKYSIIALFIGIIFIFSTVTVGAENNLNADLEILNGETNYSCFYNRGGNKYISDFSFPLDPVILNLEWNRKLNNKYLNKFNFTYGLNLNDTDTMTNKDYLYSNGTRENIVFNGEAETNDTSYNEYNLSLNSKWFEMKNDGYKYGFTVGYKHTDYKSTGENVVEKISETETPGKIWTYEAQYSIPYLGLSLKNNFNKYVFEGNLNYSPFTDFNFKNTYHYGTTQIDEGEGKGNTLMVNLKLKYDYNEKIDYYGGINYDKSTIDEDVKLTKDEASDSLKNAEQKAYGLNFGISYKF